jgi:uncharacterized membrane protein YwaF
MNIETFNAVWWSLIAAIAVVSFLIWLLFHKRSEAMRRRVIMIICIGNLLLFLLYKYWLSQDLSYLDSYDRGTFNVWLELPLQLCNISLLLIPLSLFARRESFYAFCFYTACVGALMAIASPIALFTGDLLLPRNIGFYGTHALLIVCGVSLRTLKFIIPRQRDVFLALLILSITACAMHGVNTFIRQTFHVDANYFYTYGADGSAVLGIVHNILPVPLAYLFLLLIVIVPALMLLTALINLPGLLTRGRKRRAKKA